MAKIAFALAAIVAVAALLFRPGPVETFAFDKSFPEDGSLWAFSIVLDKDSTALSELEAGLLDKLEMSPLFRCRSGLFGERWIGKGLFSGGIQPLLLRLYKLVIEDASPPDENKFIIRHQIFGFKAPMSIRFDEFICSNPKNGKVCTKWNSVGFVSARSTKFLTKGATANPYYKQKLVMVPKSSNTPKTCPLIKEAWWCLWILCPVA